MIKKNIQLFISLISFMMICGTAQSQTLGAANIGEIINTYKDNQARFVVRYRGKFFSSQTTFAGATENYFSKGRFLAKFTVNGQELNCSVSLSDDVNSLMDFNKGDRVSLEGLIEGVTMGDIQLKSCKFNK